MTANQKLQSKIANLPTEALVELSLRFTLAASNEEIVLCNRAERELETRLSANDFAAHMNAVDSMMELAA